MSTLFFSFLWQVCDVVDRLFVAIFDHLSKSCARELEAIQRQYPFKPLKASILFCQITVRYKTDFRF
jgi:hypothetical protein